MSDPAPFQSPITRQQFAQFVTDSGGQPLTSVIQNLEQQQAAVQLDIPAQVAEAIATADAASATANAVNAKVQAGGFILAFPDGDLSNARAIAPGSGITMQDTGAGGVFTIGIAQTIAILAADTFDITAVFVNAGNLSAVLAANSTYLVEASLAFQSAALTTGMALGFTLPAGASITGGYSHQATATGSQSAYNTASGTVNSNTSAVPVINANLPLTGRWVIATGANAGVAQLQYRSGVAASAITLKAALSALVFRKIG